MRDNNHSKLCENLAVTNSGYLSADVIKNIQQKGEETSWSLHTQCESKGG